MTFTSGVWKVIEGAMVVAQGNKTRTLYMTFSCKDTIVVVDDNFNLDLWNFRFGHMSEKGMKMLSLKGKLLWLIFVEHSLCKDCIFRKQKKVSFSKVKMEPKAKKNLSWFISMCKDLFLLHSL